MKPTFVYFVKSVREESPIKIGYSATPPLRLVALNSWSPFELELLAHAPGGVREEHALHWQFVYDRLHGEWFKPSAALWSLIEHVRSTGALPDLETPPDPMTIGAIMAKLPLSAQAQFNARRKGVATRLITRVMKQLYGNVDHPPLPDDIQRIEDGYTMRGASSPTDEEFARLRAWEKEAFDAPACPHGLLYPKEWAAYRRANGRPLSPYYEKKYPVLVGEPSS